MLRHLSSFPLPGNLQTRLRENGFNFCEDLYHGSSNVGKDLIKQWGLDPGLKDLTAAPSSKSALDLWQEECSTPHIVTFCKALDRLLDGGIAIADLSELCGAPGSGKTQLCLQLCVDVQIPKSFGGLAGEAIFIDTDSGFSPERLQDIAEACIQHCQMVASQEGQDDMKNEISNFTKESIMQGIHYFAAEDYVQLLGALYSLDNFLQDNRKIKLIVIDSLAFPFRNGIIDSLLKTRLLCSIMDELRMLAVKYKVAVIVTNLLTTKVTGNNESHLIPALGDSFGQHSKQRIMLGHLHHDSYAAFLFKSVTKPQSSAKFQILKSGIRDCNLAVN